MTLCAVRPAFVAFDTTGTAIQAEVDHDNKYIEYLGWTFYTRFDKDVGVQFYEVYFKGEKIFYELALQDAVCSVCRK